MTAQSAPPLFIGGPSSAAWRQEAIARAHGLSFLTEWAREGPELISADSVSAIHEHVRAAREAADGSDSGTFLRTWRRVNGSSFERALANLDTAEVDLLRLVSQPTLQGAFPSIQSHVNRFLAKDDPRRIAVDALSTRPPLPFCSRERELLLNALFAANTQRRRDLIRVRSFRNMLRGGIAVAIVLALVVAWIGWADPNAIPLCFTPESNGTVSVACPQGESLLGQSGTIIDLDRAIDRVVQPGDILLIEFFGVLGAALSVFAVLRNLKKGTSTPYNIQFSLALLKLPTGALTAVAGLVLMRADFVPGLSALDNSAQILGWALIFGIAQQLVTRLADSHADSLLENVGGRGAAGDRVLKNR